LSTIFIISIVNQAEPGFPFSAILYLQSGNHSIVSTDSVFLTKFFMTCVNYRF